MSKVVFTGDLHFHDYKTTRGVNLEQVFTVWNQILNYCKDDPDIKDIVILGDLFHVRGRIPVIVFNKVNDCLKETVSKGIRIKILPGNHDITYDGAEETTSIYTLKRIDGIEILNENDFFIENTRFKSFPYFEDKKKLREKISLVNLSRDKTNILLLHETLQGSVIESGHIFDGLDVSKFEFDYVLAGHIHHPQILFNGKGIVLGAPLCHNKKDMNSDRGFWVLDCKEPKKGLLFVPTKHPKFLSFVVEDEKDIDEILKDMSKDDFLYLTIPRNLSNNAIKKFSGYNVQFEVLDEKTSQKKRLDASLNDSEEVVIQKYIDIYGQEYNRQFLNKLVDKFFSKIHD